MLVYVLDINGHPLMPTKRFGKVRRMLRDGQAKVVKRTPFTIELLYEVEEEILQPITLGVDAGSKTIGLSASTDKKELFVGEYELRNDISKKLSAKRETRRTRRNRLRYRPPRFMNRVASKKKGWLAPSVEHKINSHLKIIEDLHEILPITKIIVEVASFDIQKIKNPNIEGKEYQEGEQLGFWNVREYVFFRDGHVCQHCKGKSDDKVLNVHHIIHRQDGGSNAPSNLITLCETCHHNYHQGKIELKVKNAPAFKDAAFMGIMRWAFYNKLKEIYIDVSLTYGYITKSTRINLGIDKTHYNDAYCIAGNLNAERNDIYYYFKKVRCHNRQIHKANKLKGGKLKRNQAPYEVHGFRLFDKVEYEGKNYFIFARRQSGYFDIRNLNGDRLPSVSYKKLKLIQMRKGILIEERKVNGNSSPQLEQGVSLPRNL